MKKYFPSDLGSTDLSGSNYLQIQSKEFLLSSPSYRVFMFDDIRMSSDSLTRKIKQQLGVTVNGRVASPWIEYGKSILINELFVRDWFRAKSVVFSISHYDKKEAQKVSDQFINECENGMIKELFLQSVVDAEKLRKGSLAPPIKLMNEQKQLVSLRDYLGKVVYINFWSIHCAPCIVELRDHWPQFADRFKEVVVLNICMECNEKSWLKDIGKYNIKNVNLNDISGVTNAYNIMSIPHGVLIDKEGRIVEYRADPPAEYLINSSAITNLLK
jgi:peroxiredoxin